MAWVSGPDKTDEAERQRAEGGDTDLVGGGRRRAVVMGRGEGTRNPIRWGVSRSESGPTRCGSRPITGGGFVAVVGFGSALRDGRPRCHHVCRLLASVWWAELVLGWSLEFGVWRPVDSVKRERVQCSDESRIFTSRNSWESCHRMVNCTFQNFAFVVLSEKIRESSVNDHTHSPYGP
jgi:hypothetical protein